MIDLDDVFVDVEADRRQHRFEHRVLPAARKEVGVTVVETVEEARGRARGRRPAPRRRAFMKMYGSAAWRKLRELVLGESPICEYCRERLAEEVDHIEKHRGDWERFLDRENCASICRPCHVRKTSRGG